MACKRTKTAEPKHLKIVNRDPYLQAYESALQGRYDYAVNKENNLRAGRHRCS